MTETVDDSNEWWHQKTQTQTRGLTGNKRHQLGLAVLRFHPQRQAGFWQWWSCWSNQREVRISIQKSESAQTCWSQHKHDESVQRCWSNHIDVGVSTEKLESAQRHWSQHRDVGVSTEMLEQPQRSWSPHREVGVSTEKNTAEPTDLLTSVLTW